MDFLDYDIVDDDTIHANVSRMYQDIMASLDKESQQTLTRTLHWYQTASLKTAVLGVGESVPDLLLPLPNKAPERLYDLLNDGPVIFVFFRSDWCTYCNYYIELLRKALPAFQGANARMFAVTPEQTFTRSDWYRYNSHGFEVLKDVNMEIVNAFNMDYQVPEFLEAFLKKNGIEPFQAEQEWRLPLTGAFIIDQDQTIAWRHVEQDYRYRATPQQLLDGLAGIAKSPKLAS